MSGVRRLARRRHEAGAIGHAVSFALHVATGFVAVAAHYAIMGALMGAGAPALWASGTGFLGGALVRFVSSYYGIFESTRGMVHAGWRFVVAIAAQALVNTLLLAGLLALDVPVWPAQVAVTVAVTLLNYLVYRLWVFR
jgi:putative flippase GtrA